MLWIETGLGYDITLWFNKLGEGFLGSVLNVFTYVGSETFYILFIPLIFWCINKSIGKRVLIITLLTAYINVLLKNLWLRPRPFNVLVEGKQPITNRIDIIDKYGFPSLQIMGVTSLWVYISTLSKKISSKILCYLIILLSTVARLVNGVNFIHSVLLAIIFSLLILLLFKIFEPKITITCNQKYTVKQRILLITFFTVAAIIVLIFFRTYNITTAIIFIACFFGGTIGIVLEKEYLDFSVDGSLILRIGRYFLGLILISIIYYGIDMLYNVIDINNYIILFLKYGIITFITAYPIPKLFVFMNLCSINGRRHL